MSNIITINTQDVIISKYEAVFDAIWNCAYTHYTLYGGRGSTKSSFVSIVVPLLLIEHPDIHACVFRKVGNTIKTSVFTQYIWAIDILGLNDLFRIKYNPPEIVLEKTGQKILFLGLDDAGKTKSIKVPFGYIAITHFEELDQFAGTAEIRKTLQSTMRGGERFWDFRTFNPPISIKNWANQEILIKRKDTLNVKSCFTEVPKAWLGKQFLEEAQILKEINPRAYMHEYLGIPTGTGGTVFENLVVRAISDEEVARFDRIYMGLDWGWFPDPFHFVKMHYDMARRTLYIFDEYRTFKTSNEQTWKNLQKLKGISAGDLITADSAEPKSISDYRSYGSTCRGAEKGAGSVDYSMKWLQSLNQIVIDDNRAPEAAKEFLEYEYEKTKDGEIISGYPDTDNHSIDATRYALERVWKRKGQ